MHIFNRQADFNRTFEIYYQRQIYNWFCSNNGRFASRASVFIARILEKQ